MLYTLKIDSPYKLYQNEVENLIDKYLPKILDIRYLDEFKVSIEQNYEDLLIYGGHWETSLADNYCAIRIIFENIPERNYLLDELENSLMSATN